MRESGGLKNQESFFLFLFILFMVDTRACLYEEKKIQQLQRVKREEGHFRKVFERLRQEDFLNRILPLFLQQERNKV